jgi:hypothetical protein
MWVAWWLFLDGMRLILSSFPLYNLSGLDRTLTFFIYCIQNTIWIFPGGEIHGWSEYDQSK